MAKAFGIVWHDRLTHKLIKFRIPLILIRLIRSVMSNRSFGTRMDIMDKTFPDRKYHTVLYFPLSSIIYTPQTCPYNLRLPGLGTAILAASSNAEVTTKLIQDYLEILENWLLTVNSDKSSTLLISRKRKIPQNLSTLNLFDTEIQWKTDLKYLGSTKTYFSYTKP